MSFENRTREIGTFDEGEWVRVHYRTSPSAAGSEIEVQVEMAYNDKKVLATDDEGRELIVDLSERHDDNIRTFRTEETEYLGRGMFAEPAENPEEVDQ